VRPASANVQSAADPEVEIFVDGSGMDDRRAGWGFVVTTSGHDLDDAHGATGR